MTCQNVVRQNGVGLQKKGECKRFIKQSIKFARASRFLLHDYDVKMSNFTFYGGHKRATTKFSFSF